MLYIVSTPIGNLKDITLRALETLQAVDIIVCEDTRRTSLLLNHYGIKKTLIILNDFNEVKMIPKIIEYLQAGEKIALVSDAGTPLISDPGYKLVRSCYENNIPVDAIPGPSAAIDALVLSGMPPNRFTFLGYPPEKPGKRLKLFKNIMHRHSEPIRPEGSRPRRIVSESLDSDWKIPKQVRDDKIELGNTYVFYVSPHKLIKTLLDIQSVFGEIEIVLAHELTKIHQSVEKKPASVWNDYFKERKPKGEYVMLISLS